MRRCVKQEQTQYQPNARQFAGTLNWSAKFFRQITASGAVSRCLPLQLHLLITIWAQKHFVFPKYSGLTPESSGLTFEMFRQITSTFRCSILPEEFRYRAPDIILACAVARLPLRHLGFLVRYIAAITLPSSQFIMHHCAFVILS